MRDQFPFLGIPSPVQRVLARTVLDGLPAAYCRAQSPSLAPPTRAQGVPPRPVREGLPAPAEPDLRAVALACWRLDEREYQYFACDWLRRHVAVPGPGFLDTVRTLIV